jgi:hypothetical protein
MNGDVRTLRWHPLEIGEKLQKVFHLVGSDREPKRRDLPRIRAAVFATGRIGVCFLRQG